jgi:hypothetical protein
LAFKTFGWRLPKSYPNRIDLGRYFPVDVEKTLQLLFHANRLKAIPPVGWQMRGVFHPESVAEHTFGVAFLAMILADSIEEEVNRERLLAIALLHDLGEAFITDLPEPALRFLPRGAKKGSRGCGFARHAARLPLC